MPDNVLYIIGNGFDMHHVISDFTNCIHWYISYHSDSEKERLTKSFKDHISSDTSKLTMFKLEDLMFK